MRGEEHNERLRWDWAKAGLSEVNIRGLNIRQAQQPAEAEFVKPDGFDSDNLTLGIQIHG